MSRRNQPDLKDQVIASIGGDGVIRLVQSMGFDARRSGSEHKILCPFHDDSKPSLSINTRKSRQGIFKCFACGWGGDIFSFAGEVNGIRDFPAQVKLVARLCGLSDEAVPVKPEDRSRRESKKKAPEVREMTPGDVLGVYKAIREAADDPGAWADELGVEARAMDCLGAVVCRQPYVSDTGDSLEVRFLERPVLAVPMRGPDGALASIRFRCFESKRRWSVDAKRRIDGQPVATRVARAGLMFAQYLLDPNLSSDGVYTVIVEGETDLLAGMTMMVRGFGDDPAEWPARWIALPGVNTAHDLVLKMPLTSGVITFFDFDDAGLKAVFDHRRERAARDDDGNVITGPGRRMERDLENPPDPGLLRKITCNGRVARAAFPPQTDSGKTDLRDLVRSGWDWAQFFNYCVAQSTADFRGTKAHLAMAERKKRMGG